MTIDYRLPKLAMSMNEGTINQWLVKEGEHIEKGQTILELETDKVVQEIESPEAGYFHIVASEGETLKVDTLIAQICQSKEELLSLAESGASTAAIDTESSDMQINMGQASSGKEGKEGGVGHANLWNLWCSSEQVGSTDWGFF